MSRSQDLINSAAVKAYILNVAKEVRPGWSCTRVSAKALNLINARLKMSVQGMVRHHPCIGCTFTEVN